MKRIIIPKSKLARQLGEAAQLKAEATELLRQLEQQYLGQTVQKPGGWRQDPLGWSKRQRKN